MRSPEVKTATAAPDLRNLICTLDSVHSVSGTRVGSPTVFRANRILCEGWLWAKFLACVVKAACCQGMPECPSELQTIISRPLTLNAMIAVPGRISHPSRRSVIWKSDRFSVIAAGRRRCCMSATPRCRAPRPRATPVERKADTERHLRTQYFPHEATDATRTRGIRSRARLGIVNHRRPSAFVHHPR